MSPFALRPLRILALLVLSIACASTPPKGAGPESPSEPMASESTETVLAHDVRVRRIAPGVWLHETLAGEDWDNVPANGLLIEDGEGALLVDTGWNARQAEQLLAWARNTLHHPVRAAVVTHFHADRTGGIPALVAQGLPVHGLEDTAKLAAASGMPVPAQTFSEARTLGPLELFFPGAGHARDNLIVWHRASGVLFGGCAVKEADAKGLGNVADADVSAWPTSLERVRLRFPEASIVVPGHGRPGGPKLLTHTQALLREAAAASTEVTGPSGH
jgi:metallo-beta-lactamase class B